MSGEIRPIFLDFDHDPAADRAYIEARWGIKVPARDEVRDEEDRDPDLPGDLEAESQARAYLHSLYLLGY